MSKVLIIGAGSVGGVVAHKCAQRADVFSQILLASRTPGRCEVIQAQVRAMHGRDIMTAELDADDVRRTTALLEGFKPDVVIHVALPYQDLHVMDACLAAGVPYLDVAGYQTRESARSEYRWQWAYHERFQDAGVTALLGSGFGPGTSNAFCAYAQKKLFDEIGTIDILDCNAGTHGHAFATDKNPELAIREITRRGRFWEEGEWNETEPLAERMVFDFPEVGPRNAYLLDHEALESLARNIRGLRRIRSWKTFDDEYLTHVRVLENVGLTRTEPVVHRGEEIRPIEFLHTLLPETWSLGAGYQGKTCAGCLIDGLKDGKRKRVFIYHAGDHQACFQDARAHVAAYAAGVSAMAGALMLLQGTWRHPGVVNLEQLDPEPFLAAVAEHGLPWQVQEL